MLKSRRLTLLIIPEEGGRTFEFRMPGMLVLGGILAGLVLVGLLSLGLYSYFEAGRLGRKVAHLEKEKAMLVGEVGQIRRLEQSLAQLEGSNRQLRAIMGGAVGLESEFEAARAPKRPEQYISAVARLRWGRVRSVPTLWPVRGVVQRPFSAAFPAVVIAAPPRSLVRAGATGRVVRAEFDARLGFVVELDHGNDMLTRYGYNAQLLVSVGEFAQKGQPIALSGHSGEAETPGLYYAVLERGLPCDPQLYRLWL